MDIPDVKERHRGLKIVPATQTTTPRQSVPKTDFAPDDIHLSRSSGSFSAQIRRSDFTVILLFAV
ncbi:hypothetical protein [Advenella sp. S44]|uniref:hypothetical protein n=1 Tax=Advenella sp. S44 TaxID=1982755 RepID=UPI0012906FC6|nr:hypothetical protein [Advenella sp. S44]